MGLGLIGGGLISNDFDSGFIPFLADSRSSPIVRMRDLNLSCPVEREDGAGIMVLISVGALSGGGDGCVAGGAENLEEGGVGCKGEEKGDGGFGVDGRAGDGLNGIKGEGLGSEIFGKSLSKSSISFGSSKEGF